MLLVGFNDPIKKQLLASLKREGYQTLASDTLTDAAVKLATNKPGVVLHNWDAFDHSQSVKFQMQCARTLDFADICRIVHAGNVNAQVLATMVDYGVYRVLSSDSATVQIVSEIKKAHVATRHLATLRAMVLSYNSTPEYDQDSIDRAVRKAFEAYPASPITRLEFGNLCVREGKVEEGMAIAKKILSEEPGNVRAMNLVGRCHMARGELKEALAVLGDANIISPFNSERLILIARALLESGNIQSATKAMSQALEIDASVKDELKRLGLERLEAGQVSAAAEIFLTSLSEDEAVSLLNNAAVVAVKKPDIPAAISLFELALKAARSPQLKSIVLYNLGLNLARADRVAESKASFAQAIELDAKNEKARRQLKKLEN